LYLDKLNFRTEALVLRGTFHVLTGNTKDALRDLNEVINMCDANVKVSVYLFNLIICKQNELNVKGKCWIKDNNL